MVRSMMTTLLVAAMLAGCGAAETTDPGGDRTGDGDAGSAGTESGPPLGDDATARDTPVDGGVDPVGQLRGGPAGGEPEAVRALRQEQATEVQERIQRCMAEQGFEYTPPEPPDRGPGLDRATEAAEQVEGFGITTWYGKEIDLAPPREVTGDEPSVDPDQQRRQQMSESERQDYDKAMYGAAVTRDDAPEDRKGVPGEVVESDPETAEETQVVPGYGGGCHGEAHEAVYGDPEEQQERWEALGTAIREMYERVQTDPRLTEANEEWSACMADAGYDYPNRQTMRNETFPELRERLDRIVAGAGDGIADPVSELTPEERGALVEDHTEDEIRALSEEQQRERREPIDEEALAALQQEEIDLAEADAGCAEELEDVTAEVTAEYETEMIEEHRELLEEIRRNGEDS